MKKALTIFFSILSLVGCFFWGAWASPFCASQKLSSLLLKKGNEKKSFAVLEHKSFVVVIPSYNNSEWAEKNLRSVFEQKYDNYRVIYINDASTDNTLSRVNECVAKFEQGHRVELWHNQTNRGAVDNIHRAVHSCLDDEIVVLLDGDDWFSHDRVLEKLNEVYADSSVWLTYGSYIEYPNYSYTVANFSRKLPRKVIEKNEVRNFTKKHWCLSHLRTFYSSLFKKIKIGDLLYEGKYFDTAYDLAFMIPMVEMAGSHAKYLREVFYIYNRATPLNDNKIRAKRQQQIAEYIIGLPRYSPLTSLGWDGEKEGDKL